MGLLAELVVEGGTAAHDVQEANPEAAALPRSRLPALALDSREEPKSPSAGTRLIVRAPGRHGRTRTSCCGAGCSSEERRSSLYRSASDRPRCPLAAR